LKNRPYYSLQALMEFYNSLIETYDFWQWRKFHRIGYNIKRHKDDA